MIPRLDIAYANSPCESPQVKPTCPFCGAKYDAEAEDDKWVSYFGWSFNDSVLIHEWFCYGCRTGWEVVYVPSALVIKEAQ